MISQVFTQNAFKVISLFSLSPGSRFNRKEIKERTFLNNQPLDDALAGLLSSGIIRKEGNYYSVNFENEYSQRLIELCLKQHKQMKSLPLKVYFLIADLVSALSKKKGMETYLFGSYSKLIFTDESDIDIAVLYTSVDKKAIGKEAEKLEKSYGKKVQMHFFDKKAFYSNKKDPLVREILKNGVKLI